MKKTIVLNHKSNLTFPEVQNYLLDINDIIRTDINCIICPSNVYIPYFKGKYNFSLGVQNLNNSSLNGEVTGKVLKSLGVKYVLLGHHDRTNYLHETKEEINKKIKDALDNCITPIVILGETYYQKELKKTGEIIGKQIKDYFKDIEVGKDIILVYEPNWTFKDKQIPSKEYVTEVVDLIKNIIKRKYHENLKVLYGGNITPNIISIINKIPNIDGLLIGKSSTSLKTLKQIFETLE